MRDDSRPWAPIYYTKPIYETSLGGSIIDFSREFLTASRGMKAGQPLELQVWQRWLLYNLFETDRKGYMRYQQAVIGLPRKNGKSILGTVIALYFLVYGGKTLPNTDLRVADSGIEIYSVAKDSKQAGIVFEEAKKQVERSKYLSTIIEIRKDSLRNKLTGAIYKVLSGDSGANQGYAPYVVIADEIHAWTAPSARELWASFTEGSGDRDESIVIGITTAGGNKDTLLGERYTHGVELSEKDSYSPGEERVGFFWWGAREGEPVASEEIWKYANPSLLNGLMSMDNMRTSYSTNLHAFMRYRLNLWVKLSGEVFMPESLWENIKIPGARIPIGAEITLGFDGSRSEDSTGIVGIDAKTGVMELLYEWEKDPNKPGEIVDPEEINAKLEEIFRLYKVKKMYCDPSHYEGEVTRWQNKYGAAIVKRIPQSGKSRMVEHTGAFKTAVMKKELAHAGNSGETPYKKELGRKLTRHALNAVEREGNVYKEKRNSPHKIDFLVCAILAHAALLEYRAQNTGPRQIFEGFKL